MAQVAATSDGSGWLKPVARLEMADSPITIRRHAELEKPFTVAGECGAMMGKQDGSFEAWIFPVKLFRQMTIEARVSGYDVPIDVNRIAAEIEVSPDHTTITYSHIAFTLKETLFATQCAGQDGAGIMALFEIRAIRPVTLTFSFVPEMRRMWPAAVSAMVDAEWVPESKQKTTLNDTTRPGGSGASYPPGWYMLHTDSPDLAGAIALPGSQPGILEPYQEKPAMYPLQFVLSFDPARDSGSVFPLLMAVGTTAATASREALEQHLAILNANVGELYRKNADYYAHFFDHRTTVETPDAAFNRDIEWAELAIDQARVRYHDEVGLVAGFYSSGASARPGFGWFFGRDTLFTSWAINSEGDYSLTRQALSFLIRRQRDDGKMPHEYSQSADQVDWAHMPYEYAAADATPLFLMAMEDYVTTSGDVAFLRENWTAVQKAWTFESTHDSDGDGIYDNAQGTGWVESWPQGMPHQEIYLAALDEQASQAMEHLSKLSGHQDETPVIQKRADAIADTILGEYTEPDGMYAFSHNPQGAADATASIYPSIAWWSGSYQLPKAETMFSRWASHEFSTDWGVRDLSEQTAIYDPISYHQGSVWPLFTGWASLAEYRTHHDLSAYAHLMQNANLTDEQDLGAVTELLSGAYYSILGRSTSHQMWSSAMVLTPALRGLFGVSVDALTGTIHVEPHLPAQWPVADLHHVRVSDQSVDLHFERKNGAMVVTLSGGGSKVMLEGEDGKKGKELVIPLPKVEVGMAYGATEALPLPGAVTEGMKVLSEDSADHRLVLELEAQGGSVQRMFLRWNEVGVRVKVEGGTIVGEALTVRFPEGNGYQRQRVVLSW